MTITLPKKLISTALALVTAATLAVVGTVSAIGEGQIEGGDIYRVKNVTQNTGFSDSVAAEPCDTVQYKVRFHNPGPGVVNNVHVKATLPSAAATTHASTVTITAENAQPATRTDTATVNVSSAQKISYIGGSTQLLDTNSNVLQNLPDGITGSGITIGSVGVSLNEIKFVQFKAKLDCPPPKPPESKGECKAVNVQVTDKKKREVKATVTGTVHNAEIIGYRIDFGDGTVVNEQTATHAYAKDGTYTITTYVQIKFADGKTEWKTAAACKAKVTFEKEKPPVVVPPTEQPPAQPPSVTTVTAGAAPVSLPKTGAGSAIAIAAIVSLLGAVLHRRFTTSQLSE